MKKFFPNYISHVIQLLEKYYEFTASKDSNKIAILPILLERIENLRREFKLLRNRDDLTEPDQFSRNLRSFQTLLMQMEELESFGLPIVTHYQQRFEGRLNSIMKQLCSEVGSPVDTPHVCAISTGTSGHGRDYYWYHGYFDTIFVPAAETFSLLNLPDLLHELGHHILKTYHHTFLNPFIEWIIEYKEKLDKVILLEDIQDPERISESQKVFSRFWPESWRDELVCDLIAIYCVGQAYAWTNLKICQSNFPGNSIYFYSDSHPADAYRMDVIFAMLRYLGLSEENIRKAWLEYAAIFQRDKSFLYEHFFPPGLTKTIAQHVYEICNDIGLVPCTENLKKDNTLISKLNRAWCLFRGELKPNPKKTKKGSPGA
jgi:hypothetical protein